MLLQIALAVEKIAVPAPLRPSREPVGERSLEATADSAPFFVIIYR